jgi:hypothetical protein
MLHSTEDANWQHQFAADGIVQPTPCRASAPPDDHFHDFVNINREIQAAKGPNQYPPAIHAILDAGASGATVVVVGSQQLVWLLQCN